MTENITVDETTEDTGNIFGDLDLEGASDNPFAPDPGTYHGYIKSSKITRLKNGVRKWVLTYMVEDDNYPEQNKKTAQEWLTIPDAAGMNTPDGRRQRSFLKLRWRTLGFTPEAASTAKPADVVNYPVKFTVRTSGDNGEYINVVNVSLAEKKITSDFDQF